ncbi:MAG TPA: tRNA uridine-5-carboxymethylaminomethyl(34) synthesis enzyme MnmG, partial [Candidatus Omnitrophota bacterium]|nr:tRNA uridine-5-carboxymethylaminomethyl(34) synthesis enzyme MnmG [Candidatus Omnitrophota bacterium]
TPKGEGAGCIGSERSLRFRKKEEALVAGRQLLAELRASPTVLKRQGLEVNQDGVVRSAWDLLAYPTIDLARLAGLWPEIGALRADVAEQLEIEGKYHAYLQRQETDIRTYRRDEDLALPDDLDYDAIGSLSNEVRSKLKAARPETLAAAARIPGVTPAALTALLGHVKKKTAA